MKTIKFITKRIVSAIPILIGVIVITFFLMRMLPGDPVAFFTKGPGIGPEEIEAVRNKLGLDKPLAVQLWMFFKDILKGDLGQSFKTGNPVLKDLRYLLPASLELSIIALVIASTPNSIARVGIRSSAA